MLRSDIPKETYRRQEERPFNYGPTEAVTTDDGGPRLRGVG